MLVIIYYTDAILASEGWQAVSRVIIASNSHGVAQEHFISGKV
jgi:hypothetical protein